MSAIDYDNGWPAFDGCMPFWQPSCITNFCLVIVFILLWKINFFSLSRVQFFTGKGRKHPQQFGRAKKFTIRRDFEQLLIMARNFSGSNEDIDKR